MSWPLVSLSSIAEVVTGNTPSKADESFFGGDIPFVSPSELDLGYVSSSKQTLTAKGASVSRLIPADSVMVCCIGSLGKVGISSIPVVTNQQINSLVVNHEVAYPLYVYYFCKTLKNTLNDMAPKTTVAIVNKTKFSALKIPLPPLETQKKIAAVLEKADQLRKDCQQMEQELNSLAQSVFIDMFGDPVTNPKGWDKAPLSAIIEEFLGGKSLVAADNQNTEYKNRVLKISAVTSGEFKSKESKPLPNDYEPQVEHFVKTGDLLFSRANTTELVGATTMVFDQHTGLVLPDKLWRFVWKDEKSLSPVFIWQQLCEAGVRKEISKLSSGSGGSMKNISKGKLNTLQIVLPPLELQQKFERIYLKLRVELSNNQQQAKFAVQAFNSLMQKAFKGELNL
ncbi:restriction endonuclease subunit S [Vibrio splendidus]